MSDADALNEADAPPHAREDVPIEVYHRLRGRLDAESADLRVALRLLMRCRAEIERLREGIRGVAIELEADIPYDAGNDHCHHIARILRALLDEENVRG